MNKPFTPDHLPDDWAYEKRADGIAVFDADGVPRCGSITSRKTPCKKYPVKGRYRCRKHGGAVPRGFAHPHTKDGIYSAFLPTALASRHAELIENQQLTDLTENLALVDVRLQGLLAALEKGDLGDTYFDLRDQYNHCAMLLKQFFDETAPNVRAKLLERFTVEFQAMKRLIDQGLNDHKTWREALQVNEQRRKMAETIQKLKLQGERSVSVDELMLFVTAIASIFEAANRLPTEQARSAEFVKGVDDILKFPGGKAG